LVLLFDLEKDVKDKNDLMQWFTASKKLMKDGKEFKNTLIRRVEKEEINEKQ